jgi:hypothetical protein
VLHEVRQGRVLVVVFEHEPAFTDEAAVRRAFSAQRGFCPTGT